MVFPSAIPIADLVLKTGIQKGGAIDPKKGGAIDPEKGGAIDPKKGGAITKKKLTKRQIEVLSIITTNNSIGYRALAEKMKINESAVLKHIEQLKGKGYIIRQGGTRGFWKIIS